MPFVSINDILGAPNLCGIIQSTVSGIPNPFPEAFFKVDQTVDGDTGEYKVFSGARTNATISPYGAPSKNRQLREIGIKSVKLLHSIENIVLPVKDYINLLNYTELSKQRMGIDEVSRQIREARWTQDNLRISALTSMLFKTQIYYDGLGNLLPSSAGAQTAVDYAVPAGNQNQLDVFNTATPIISTKWSDPTATIDKQLQALHQAAVQLTGYELKHAFYGKNVPNYLTSNNGLGNYFFRANYGPEAFGPDYIATADIPNPLLGLTWHKAYQSFFYDQNGVRQTLVGDDQIVFTPEPSNAWIGFLEGTYPVPSKAGIITPAEPSVVSSIETKAGMFAYGAASADPPTAKIVYGDTFLPVLKVPTAVFVATVKF
ncbi:MAG: major capsid protein [Planctomycetota bacterium]|nr:major capsid protein [Planctomycetota bacterium]